ncbi:LOG family protein [Bacteroides caecigallinarum]|uniref:LOG family protein n=1 Tax=Bacteroides caecigallinarum TaxID=1411144 RepID=UPI00195D1741|nr:TIGR00730 family Rossman fold protein [Bacteroides caecigallinarum]MBM6883782.1 TIGR00730 family Rossman fold protein [Bacteroides caecigallinarum]MBM6891029.1 TIGR00730 family Rossman fold protein [Bacteroides caecigallinarum]MCF2550815.1 TIGR00730 family Rossman fold protein [Bacteroides caecigallinarum]
MENIKSVCVYCASSTKIDEAYFEAAKQLGELLAEKNIRIINGAGCQGLMAAVSDSALEAGGKVTGVIPHFMVEQGWNHTGLTQTIETETMHERKNLMAEMSDAVITLPGGCGTLEELLEIITWKQLGLYLKPIVILNINGYFNSLIEMLEKAIEQNFMRPEHEKLWEMANTPEEAVELLFKIPMWNKEFRKFAAI